MRADLRLVVPAVLVWCAALVLVGVPEWALACAIAGGIFSTVLVLGVARHRSSGGLALLLVSMVLLGLVGCRVLIMQESRVLSELGGRDSDTSLVCAEFLLTGSPRPANSSFGNSMFVSATMREVWECSSGDGARVQVNSPVLLYADGTAMTDGAEGKASIGWSLSGRVRLSPSDPGDQRAYRAQLDAGSVTSAPPGAVVSAVNGLRASFRALSASMPGRGGELLPGLAIGDTELVSHELEAEMKASSLTHLTAVSGANCAVITGLIMGVGRWCGVGRRFRLAGAVVALLAFVVLVTPEPSVLRAAVMSVVVMVSLGSGRPGSGLSSLCVAVIGLVLWDPWMARHYGFALSVLATAGLLLGSRPCAERLQRVVPGWLATAVAVPLAAQVACQPVLILLQPSLPVYGVLANLVAAPAAPIATVVGLFACVLVPWVPVLAQIAIDVAWWPSSWIAQIAAVSAALPGSHVSWPPGIWGALLLAACTAAGIIALLPARSSRLHERPFRVGSAICVAIAVGVGVGTANGQDWYAKLTRPRDWSFVMCDVGQGDAVLANADGAVVMVDVGPSPDAARECLDDLGIESVDLLVLSHYDQDHVGGLAGVLDRVGDAIVAPPRGESREQRVLEQLSDAGVRVHTAQSGDEGRVGQSRWRVWGPGPVSGVGHRLTGNDLSVVIGISGPRGTGIFLGDVGESAQRDLMSRMRAADDFPRADVVKVSHHGSRDQYAELYRTLAAPIALVSVGSGNGYGHPTDSALALLEETGSTVLRSDTLGTVMVTGGPGPGGWSVWSSGADSAGENK